MNKQAATIIEKAASKMVLDPKLRFFSTLFFRTEVIESDLNDTAWTDGRKIGYNPQFVCEVENKQGLGAIVGLLLHEVLHCAFTHMGRRGFRDPYWWNVACDYAVNELILETGIILPDGGLYDPRFSGMAAEEIYSLITENMPKAISPTAWGLGDLIENDQGNQEGQGAGGQGSAAEGTSDQSEGKGRGSGNSRQDGDGGGDDSQGQNPFEGSKGLKDYWNQAVREALFAAEEMEKRNIGSLPAHLKRAFEKMLKPVLPWPDLLAEFVDKSSEGYNWWRKDRRFTDEELFVPDWGVESLGEIVFAIDTSGSITEKELARFWAELKGIVEMKPSLVHIVGCDADIHLWKEWSPGEGDIKFELDGGGGTSFVPVFEEVDKRGLRPRCLVYLTDSFGTFPDSEPDYPVLWALVVEETSVPWGRTVFIPKK